MLRIAQLQMPMACRLPNDAVPQVPPQRIAKANEMTDLLKTFLRFLWRRDPESACCVGIVLSEWLDDRYCRELADFYMAVIENRKVRRARGESV